MGLFDDAVPGGNISKPILIAIGALLVSRMFAKKAPEGAGAPAQIPEEEADGGLAGGLGGLLEKLQKGGLGDVADSWVSPGANKPVQPKDLGAALGNSTISDIARQAGISEQDLLKQLSVILPGLVDKMTPGGRVPTNREIASLLDLRS